MTSIYKFILFLSCSTYLACGSSSTTKQTSRNHRPRSVLIDSVHAIIKGDSIIDKQKTNPKRYFSEGTLYVYVDNVDSLYANMRSNTFIMLASDTFYLDEIDRTILNPNANWAWVLFDEIILNQSSEDEQTLLLSKLENFGLVPWRKDSIRPTILTRKIDASVLALAHCKNIQINGLSFGHENETLNDPHDVYVSYCSGEVLEFFDSEDIRMDKLDLFGCGTRGFLAHRCKGLTMINSDIHHCTYGAFGLFDCNNITISTTQLRDIRYRELIEIENSTHIDLAYIDVTHNTVTDEYTELPFNIDMTSQVNFNNISFTDNDFDEETFYTGFTEDTIKH